MNSFSYRKDLDGLRALSVLAVIFYHLKLSILGADLFGEGYIRVDIFFVISGYLITDQIVYEIREKRT